MKKTILFCLMAAAMVCSCQKEEPGNETNKGNSGTSATIYIDGETVNPPVNVRSTDGTVYFEGGYATGAGIYDGKAQPTVEAHPDKGYEVDFFYGGPESDPKKYDYITSGETNFQVILNGADHYFKCGFKEKKRTLTVNAGAGGTATGSGTYQCDTPITIKATPESGYEFAGWEINEGDVTIADKSNANTTATLNSLNSTITAKFIATVKDVTLTFGFRSSLDKYPYPTGVWSHTGAGVTPWRAWANDFTVELSEAVPYDIRVTIYLYANDYIELENDITDYISTNTYAAVFTIKANQTSISSPTLDEKHTFKEMYGSVTTSWTEAVYAYDIIVLENETNGEYNLTAKWIDVAGDDWQETTY